METPDFSVESPTLAHQEDKQAETAINRQGAAISYRHFSFKRVSDCQKADAEGVCGLSDTGRECSRLTDTFVPPLRLDCAQFSTEFLSVCA